MFRLAQPPHHLSNQHQGGSNVIQMQTDAHRVLGESCWELFGISLLLLLKVYYARNISCTKHHCYRMTYDI